MKVFATSLLLLLTIVGFSQTSLNNYKYVIVPNQFSFSHEQNEYGLNTAAKQFLQQKGFIAYLENEQMPLELAANKCNALRAEVTQKKNLFVTNLTLVLKNCQGDILFKGKEGKSREKDFGPAFQEALINAFASLNEYPYHYDSTTVITQGLPGTVASAPASTMPGNATGVPASTAMPAGTVTGAPAGSATAPTNTPAATTAANTPAAASTTGAPTGVTGSGVPASGNAVASQGNVTAVPASPVIVSDAPVEITGTLYAQAIPNGYQLIDLTPKKVLTLLKTSVPDYYIAASGPTSGIVFKKGSEWFFEYYKDNKLVSKKLDVKF